MAMDQRSLIAVKTFAGAKERDPLLAKEKDPLLAKEREEESDDWEETMLPWMFFRDNCPPILMVNALIVATVILAETTTTTVLLLRPWVERREVLFQVQDSPVQVGFARWCRKMGS